MRADSCSGPTTDSICGHGLGRMGHSSNFARWPHLGPIPPMDGGGHLVPLSYVHGYRGDVGRRGVAQDTNGDDGIKIRARVRRYQLILWRCAADFVPKSAILRFADVGQRKNGRSGGQKQGAPGSYPQQQRAASAGVSAASGRSSARGARSSILVRSWGLYVYPQLPGYIIKPLGRYPVQM